MPTTPRRLAAFQPFVELTRVVREQQETVEYGDGEDDAAPVASISEITTKLKTRTEFVRYFHARRDGRPGSELWFTNGNIVQVQDPFEEVKAKFPAFLGFTVSGAPSEIMVNPSVVRYFHPHAPSIGSATVPPGTRLTFPNGHKLEVMESYDEVSARFEIN